MTVAFIGIGSNVGERREFCRRAVRALDETTGVEVQETSGLYETAPVGGPPQRSFVNCVTKISTDLDPQSLLDACKSIERRLGREPSDIRWGPRVIDLDVLVYGEDKVSEPGLEIPHPRMTERRFVLVPLLEVDFEASDPWGTHYADWLDEAEGEIHRLEDL